MIERIIQRVKKIKEYSDIVLCTSRLSQDFPLVRIAKENNISHYKGSSEDVLQRLLNAAELFEMDYFLGITADNPLFSIHHANVILDRIRSDSTLDYIYTAGMPIGVNIYGIKTKALKVICSVKQEVDTEIWGNLINQPKIFNVKKIKVEKKYQNENYRMTLDEIKDYKFFIKLYKMFPKDSVIDLLDAYKCLEQNPEIPFINKMVLQRDLPEYIKNRISDFYKNNHNMILNLKKKIYQY